MKLDLMTVLLTFPAFATSGCENKRSAPSTTRTTGATTDPTDPTTATTLGGMQASSIVSATTLLAGARCDRQGACKEIGGGKRHETRETCTRDEMNRAQGDIRAADCPNGVDERKLQVCLDSIAKQECAALTTSLSTMNECKTAALCAHP